MTDRISLTERPPRPESAATARAEVSLPGLRRRGALESRQAGARLPVLRHRVAGDAARRAAPRPSSSSTIWSPRCAAFPIDARGWQAEKTSVRCQSCQAISVFDPSKVGQRCDFCGSSALVPYEEVKDAFRPESLLPLKVVRAAGARSDSRVVRPAVARAERASESKALTDTVKGIYLPYWTFDAHADADWTAEAATTTTCSEGKQAACGTCAGRPASGALSHVFDDELVCASMGVDARHAARRSSRFRPTALVPYDPGYLAGWTVERYQIDLVAAAERSRAADGCDSCDALCAAQVPGDTHRNLVVHATFSDQTFKHILAPVWLLTYIYRAEVVPGGRQRRDRHDRRRAAVELDQDHAARARCC